MVPPEKRALLSSRKTNANAEVADGDLAKRPARGFHRFRSGVLNVTPKGSEKNIVEENQSSPLLSLPPELRTKIWKYVLCGHTLYYHEYTRYGKTLATMAPPAIGDKRVLGLDILRTCRQIYSETALLPYKFNTLANGDEHGPTGYLDWIVKGIRFWRPFQCGVIENIELQLSTDPHRPFGYFGARLASRTFLSYFPRLKNIRVVSSGIATISEEQKDTARRDLLWVLCRNERAERFNITWPFTEVNAADNETPQAE